MAELAYREIYATNAVEARERLVRSYQELGSISATARLWHTARQVVRSWLRAFGVETSVTFQTDWRREFGGDNPRHVEGLSQRFLMPLVSTDLPLSCEPETGNDLLGHYNPYHSNTMPMPTSVITAPISALRLGV
ncbi:MAG: hypothetical protein ACP5R2_03145 [Anaerolineae bacterium]